MAGAMTRESAGLPPAAAGLGATVAAALRFPRVRYLGLHESPAFSIGVFVLPARGAIPLHDHPSVRGPAVRRHCARSPQMAAQAQSIA